MNKTNWYAVFEKDGKTKYESVETRNMAIALHIEGWKKVGIANDKTPGIVLVEDL